MPPTPRHNPHTPHRAQHARPPHSRAPGQSHPEARKAITGDKPRDLVCQRLAQQSRRFPDLDPTGFEASAHLQSNPRDAAFAHAVYDAVIRRWLTLDELVRSRLDKPNQALDHGIRAALLSGAAQMLMLDRVPAYAAINHSVEWVKSAVAPRAGGLVNAVLRRIAELIGAAVNADAYTIAHDEVPMDDGGAIRLPAPIFRGDPLERLALATSHPPSFARALSKHFGEAETKRLLLHSLVRPPTTLCTAYAPADALASPDLAPHDSPAHRVFTGDRAALSGLLARERKLWVQDAGSSHAVLGLSQRLGDKAPKVIVDLCAGQGTKTRQLAAEFPDAVIIATDTDEDRLLTLRAGAATTQGRIHAAAFDDVPALVKQLSGGLGAGLVLVDVPCSNAGTLARRPEAKYRMSSDQYARLLPLQRDIIRKGAALLAPLGVLLYSTCSIDPVENHDQAAWTAAELGFTLLAESQTLPASVPGDPASKYSDGSYWALLTK